MRGGAGWELHVKPGEGEETRWEPGQNHGQKAQAQRAQHAGFLLYSSLLPPGSEIKCPWFPQIDLVLYPQSICLARLGCYLMGRRSHSEEEMRS